MESEFIKMMKDIEDMLKDLKKTGLKEKINETFKQPAKISIEKNKYGVAKTSIEGNGLPILITLAGLENIVLKRLDVPNDLWEMIKKSVATIEAKDYE